MKAEYDLSKLKSRRNPYASKLKKPVTMRLSEDVVETAWDAEILKRIGEYERDEAVLSPTADVFAEARRLTQ